MPPAPISSNSVLASAAAELHGGDRAETGTGQARRTAPRDNAVMAVTDTGAPAAARERSYEELERIFADVDGAVRVRGPRRDVVERGGMLGRAGGKPIRVASKSVRCRCAAQRRSSTATPASAA